VSIYNFISHISEAADQYVFNFWLQVRNTCILVSIFV
jgi:hypothetical protein